MTAVAPTAVTGQGSPMQSAARGPPRTTRMKGAGAGNCPPGDEKRGGAGRRLLACDLQEPYLAGAGVLEYSMAREA